MASRRRTRHGILADPLAWLHERHPAGFVGAGLRALCRRLRLTLRAYRLARLVVDRNLAGTRRRVDPLLRQGTAGVGGEQAPTEGKPDGGQSATARDLQAQVPLQHADWMRLDGFG